MGFYADSTIERDFDEYVGYKNGGFDDDPEYRESFETPIISTIPVKEFEEGKDILLKCDNYRNTGRRLNRVCTIIKNTQKAILFKVNRDYENDLPQDIMFWMPRAAMYMHKSEKEIYYLKHWAKITKING